MKSVARFCEIIVFTIMSVPFLLFAKDIGLQGFNNQRFTPQIDGYGLYNINSSKVLPHLNYSFGTMMNFSRDTAQISMPARNATLDAVDNDATIDFGAALGLFDFVEVGLDIPATFYQDGYNYDDLQKYKTAAMGDLRFDTKFRLLKDGPRKPGISILSRATFPTGKRTAFTGYDGPTWEGALIMDKSFRNFTLYANAGYKFVKAVRVLSTTFDDLLTFSGGVSLSLPFVNEGLSLLAEITGESEVENFEWSTTPIEVLGGVRKEFASGISLDFGGGGGITNAVGSPSFRIMTGISFNLAKKKARLKLAVPVINAEMLNRMINFESDSYKIGVDEKVKVAEVAALLTVNRNLEVELSGHTDNTGPAKYNMNLSCKRADAVKNELLSEGVLENQIAEIKCYGKMRPLNNNKTLKDRRENRRVEIMGSSPFSPTRGKEF